MDELEKILIHFHRKVPYKSIEEILLDHNNAGPHVAAIVIIVTKFLADKKIVVVPYLAHLPHLAPCDFWLFAKVEQPLWRISLCNRYRGLEGYGGMLQTVCEQWSTSCSVLQQRGEVTLKRNVNLDDE